MEARYQLRQSPLSVDEPPVHNLTDLTVEALGPANPMTHADLHSDAAAASSDCRRRLRNGWLRLIIPTTPKRWRLAYRSDQ
jgi:hypothetical protein